MTMLNRYISYLLFLIWGLIFLIGLIFPTIPLTFLIGFLFLLFLPGFSLARIFKLEAENSHFSQWMIYLVAGLTFNFLLCLAGIILQTNIYVLEITYFALFFIFFTTAFILDYRRTNQKNATQINWSYFFNLNNLIFLLPITILVIIILIINHLGSYFAGDPAYHLAVTRKVVEGGKLGINALSFLKEYPQAQYAYLIWPVFLGLLSKIFHLNIFMVWNEIIVGILVLAALSWAWMFQQIINKKYFIALALSIFLILIFGTNGWLYTRLAVPDAVAKLVLLPLSLALTFEYVFSKIHSWKLLILTGLLMIGIACVHLTQYVYYFFMLGAFGLTYALIFWREPNWKDTIKRILLTIGLNIIFVAPLFIVLALTTNAFSEHLKWFATVKLVLIYGSFKKLDLFMQFSYIFLPLAALFCRKNPKILFLIVIMLLAPFIYHFEPLRQFLSDKLSYVFVRRLFSNVTWYFAIWAVIVAFIGLLVDRLLGLIKSDRAKTMINYGFVLITVTLFILEIYWQTISRFFNLIFASRVSHWLEANFIWLIWLVLGLVVAILIVQKYRPKLAEFFTLDEPINYLAVFCVSLLIIFGLTSDARVFGIKNFRLAVQSPQFFRSMPDATVKTANINSIGGKDVLKFIKTNLPARATFETNRGYLDLPELADVYMAAYPGADLPEKELSNLYESNGVSMSEKLTCLGWYKVDYLLITASSHKIIDMGFTNLPQYLRQIYPINTQIPNNDSQISVIYQVDWPKIKADYAINQPTPPTCRNKRFITK